MVLQDIIDHHTTEAGLARITNLDESIPAFHDAAAKTLSEVATLMDEALGGELLASLPAGIVVSLDLADQTGRITGPAFATFNAATVPSPGEAMVIDGVPYALHGRQWQLNSGALEARLLAVKIAQGPAIVAAPANALDVLSGRKQGG